MVSASFFAAAALGALASTVVAEPSRMHQAVKRQAATGPSDVEILNYALTLEASSLPRVVSSGLTADAAPRERLLQGGSREVQPGGLQSCWIPRQGPHSLCSDQRAGEEPRCVPRRRPRGRRCRIVSPLSSPNQSNHQLTRHSFGSCQYNFGLDSVDTFIAVSRILEGVGTSAYLGAAADIDDAGYLTAAGSILTIEARHTSYLNEISGASGFPVPYDAYVFFFPSQSAKRAEANDARS